MINHVPQSIQNEIPRRLAAADRELNALKNKQFAGGDSVVTGRSLEGSFTTVIPAGATVPFQMNFYGTLKVDYASELMLALFINNDVNPDYAWPYGLHVLATDLIVTPPYVDLAFSDPTGLGNKTYFCVVKNNTGSNITLYFYFALLFNEQILGIS